jgi:hypothetical protein
MILIEGEEVTQGLSWASVAERVATRSEKQCRTKWLNYLNWKQKGGVEWTREDDITLIRKLSELTVTDDTQVDWNIMAQEMKRLVKACHVCVLLSVHFLSQTQQCQISSVVAGQVVDKRHVEGYQHMSLPGMNLCFSYFLNVYFFYLCRNT